MLFMACNAYYPERQIPDVNEFTYNDTSPAPKPSIYINLLFNEAMKCPTREPDCANPSLKDTVEKIMMDAGLFSYYTFEPAHINPPDYELQIKIEYKLGGNVSALFLPFSIWSLGLIPVWSSDKLKIEANLTNNNGELIENFSYHNAIIGAVGVFFIPFARNNKEEDVYYRVMENMLRHLFFDLSPHTIKAR